MKERRLISYNFYILLGLDVLFILVDGGATISYVCGKVRWLGWIMQSSAPLPTVFAFILLFAPPFLLGLKCHFCSRRKIALYGALFTLSFGVISNLFSLLEWRVLMGCSPDIYTHAGFQLVSISSWLVLPIAALLGGVAALIGQKMSKANLDKKGKLQKNNNIRR